MRPDAETQGQDRIADQLAELLVEARAIRKLLQLAGLLVVAAVCGIMVAWSVRYLVETS